MTARQITGVAGKARRGQTPEGRAARAPIASAPKKDDGGGWSRTCDLPDVDSALLDDLADGETLSKGGDHDAAFEADRVRSPSEVPIGQAADQDFTI